MATRARGKGAAARGQGRGTAPARASAAPRRTAPPRADFGAPIEGYLGKQAPEARAVLDALRALVAEAAPGATASLKWGIPWFAVEGETFCALAGFRTHVNLILPGPPGTFADPGGLLQGEGRTGRHLKLHALEDLPRGAVRRWLRTAVRAARARAAGRGGV